MDNNEKQELVELLRESSLTDGFSGYTWTQLEALYENFITKHSHRRICLSKMFPTLKVRSLFPGDMVTVVAATGASKTYLLQFLAMHFKHNKFVFFEFEWSAERMAERFIAMLNNCHPEDVSTCEIWDKKMLGFDDNGRFFDTAGMTIDDMNKAVNNAMGS